MASEVYTEIQEMYLAQPHQRILVGENLRQTDHQNGQRRVPDVRTDSERVGAGNTKTAGAIEKKRKRAVETEECMIKIH